MKRRLDICIVTADIVGPIRNGGIGTAYYNLALALAGEGHRVTILYALGQFCEQKTIAHWTDEYKKHRITFVAAPEQPVQGRDAMKMSYAVYCWLRDRRFDVIHCHEWRGVGFYTAIAKRQGLCLRDATLIVGAHSPVLWHLEGMNEAADPEALEVDFMERESVRLADVLWTPSAHMLQWMRRAGWQLPRHVYKEPYILLDLDIRGQAAKADPEFVFFGRLETRKGLDLFCDALDQLERRGTPPRRVTFAGKIASVNGIPSDTYLATRARPWSFPWEILSTLDRTQAMKYLAGSNRVAVIPSRLDNLPYTVLECLGSNIPCLASNIGGIPEMVRPSDRRRILFDLNPTLLADRLEHAITHGLTPGVLRTRGRTSFPQKEASRGQALARKGHSRPLVSVCVTHRNRPGMLATALESIRRQNYPHFEVVLVDDGSDTAEAARYLDSLEPEFAARHWTLIRQSNRYLGAARNAAVTHARGEYILFMDDDNVATPHELSTFVRAARATGADILTCLLRVFQGDAPAPSSESGPIWPFLGGAVGPGLVRNVFGDANALIRRSVFDRIGGFTEDFGVGCEDWEFFARAVLAGLRLEVVPEPLVHYRQSPSGMLHTTSTRANRLRAMRPYLAMLPAHLRPFVHLSQYESQKSDTPPAPVDHVRRAVVFGTGEGGRHALRLAAQCGWTVPWIVDNNPAAWHTTAHGHDVKSPEALRRADDVDLVIIGSTSGRPAISAQLSEMGLVEGRQFVHFLDPVKLNGTTLRLTMG